MSDGNPEPELQFSEEHEPDPRAGSKNRAIVACLAVAGLALGLGGAYAVYDGARTNEDLCNSSVQNRLLLRGLLEESERISLEGATSTSQIEKIDKAYARLRAKVPPAKCVDGRPVELEEPTTTRGGR